MNDNQTFLSRLVDVHRLHQPLTHGRPVARVNVDVFGEETERAVAAAGPVFQGRYRSMAVLAEERFLAGEKGHRATEDSEATDATEDGTNAPRNFVSKKLTL